MCISHVLHPQEQRARCEIVAGIHDLKKSLNFCFPRKGQQSHIIQGSLCSSGPGVPTLPMRLLLCIIAPISETKASSAQMMMKMRFSSDWWAKKIRISIFHFSDVLQGQQNWVGNPFNNYFLALRDLILLDGHYYFFGHLGFTPEKSWVILGTRLMIPKKLSHHRGSSIEI